MPKEFNLFNNIELVNSIITAIIGTIITIMLTNIISYVSNKTNIYFDKFRKEKIEKRSVIEELFNQRVIYSLYQLIIYLPVLIIISFIIYLLCSILKRPSPQA